MMPIIIPFEFDPKIMTKGGLYIVNCTDAYKRRLWTKTSLFGLVRIKKHHAERSSFSDFLQSYFLELIPRACLGANVHFTGRMGKLILTPKKLYAHKRRLWTIS